MLFHYLEVIVRWSLQSIELDEEVTIYNFQRGFMYMYVSTYYLKFATQAVPRMIRSILGESLFLDSGPLAVKQKVQTLVTQITCRLKISCLFLCIHLVPLFSLPPVSRNIVRL